MLVNTEMAWRPRALDSGCWVRCSENCQRERGVSIICKACWKQTSPENKELLKREYNRLAGPSGDYQLYCSKRDCWQTVSKRNTEDKIAACAQHLGVIDDTDSSGTESRFAASATSCGMPERRWAKGDVKSDNEKQKFNEKVRCIQGQPDSSDTESRFAASATSCGMSERRWAKGDVKGDNEKQKFNEKVRCIQGQLRQMQNLLDNLTDSVANLARDSAAD